VVPLIGAEPVVPIIAISSIFTNLSRFAAYIRYADRRRALIVIAAAAVTTALGAYGYTRLTNAGAALVIGAMLIVMKHEGTVVRHVCEFLEVVPPTRLVFSWSSPYTGACCRTLAVPSSRSTSTANSPAGTSWVAFAAIRPSGSANRLP